METFSELWRLLENCVDQWGIVETIGELWRLLVLKNCGDHGELTMEISGAFINILYL